MNVEVTDLLGKKIVRKALTNNKATIDISSLVPGYYMISCYSANEQIASGKFIKN